MKLNDLYIKFDSTKNVRQLNFYFYLFIFTVHLQLFKHAIGYSSANLSKVTVLTLPRHIFFYLFFPAVKKALLKEFKSEFTHHSKCYENRLIVTKQGVQDANKEINCACSVERFIDNGTL